MAHTNLNKGDWRYELCDEAYVAASDFQVRQHGPVHLRATLSDLVVADEEPQ